MFGKLFKNKEICYYFVIIGKKLYLKILLVFTIILYYVIKNKIHERNNVLFITIFQEN